MSRKRIFLVGLAAVGFWLLGTAQSSWAYTFFQSPSKNVGCVISKSSVRCDIRSKSWRPTPKPANCPLDWGHALTVGKRGPGRFLCAGDSAAGMGKILRYGKSIRRGPFRCVSKTSGMLCRNTRNNHGFKLSKAYVRRF